MKDLSLFTYVWDSEKYYNFKKTLELHGLNPKILDEIIEDRLRVERLTYLLYCKR